MVTLRKIRFSFFYIKFLGSKLQSKEHVLQKITISYIYSGFDNTTKGFNLQCRTFSEVFALKLNHLKVVLMMFYQVFHLANIQFDGIIIISADTDFFILPIYFRTKLAKIGCQDTWFDGSHQKPPRVGCHLVA